MSILESATKHLRNVIALPIKSVRLLDVNGSQITSYTVGESPKVFKDSFKIFMIDDVSSRTDDKGFDIYAISEDSTPFVYSSVIPSVAGSVFIEYFETHAEAYEAMFGNYIPQGSTDVKYLTKLSFMWLARNSQDEIFEVPRKELSELINRNIGDFAVVAKDNYDRETVSEFFVSGNLSEDNAKGVADKYNTENKIGEHYFQAVRLPYKLFEPDF